MKVGLQTQKISRNIRQLDSNFIEEYLTIYLNAYPAFKNIDEEGRTHYRKETLKSMNNEKNIHFIGLFEGENLIATMKLIDFSMNIFGEMQPAVGLMSLAVHPLHKKKGAALEMVRYFEKYTYDSGALVALLLPFRMDFYRKMDYGFGSKLHEYCISTLQLPGASDISHLKILNSEELPKILECYSSFVKQNHGMLEKFAEEVRNMELDTLTRRIGYMDGENLKGYVAFRFVSNSSVNYTINRMEVDELIYSDSNVLKELLGFLRLQADEAQTVVIRTGEEDFYHLLDNPQDSSENYIPFGNLQTNISAVGIMHKIIDPEMFIGMTGYRLFPDEELTMKIIYEDGMDHLSSSISLKFEKNSHVEGSKWTIIPKDEKIDVVLECKKSDLSSLFLGSCDLASMVRLGILQISDLAYVERLNRLFHCSKKPWTNTDF